MSDQAAADICLALLVGLPGSGKTTLADFVKEFFSKEQETSDNTILLNIVHICYDALITIDFAHCCWSDPDGGNWRDARQEVLTMVERIVCILKDTHSDKNTHKLSLDCGKDNKFIKVDFEWEIFLNRTTVILIDDNMYYSSMRYSYFQIARRHNIGFCQFFIKCTLESALEFNKKRASEKRVPEAVVKNMADRIEPPEDKGWEQYSITLEAHKPYSCNVLEIGDMLMKALRNPVKPLENWHDLRGASCQANIASVLHQCDLVLRSLVNERMKMLQRKSSDRNDLRVQARILNTARAELLGALKTREVVIPEELYEAVQLCDPQTVSHLRAFFSPLLPP